MTKNEFLEGLRKALGNDLDRETVQENVAYYDGYISVQVNIGRTEEEVTAELGDPWVIAQTIIDAEEAKRGTGRNAGSSYTTANSGFSDPVYGDGGDYTREDYYDQNQGYQTHVHTFGFDAKATGKAGGCSPRSLATVCSLWVMIFLSPTPRF